MTFCFCKTSYKYKMVDCVSNRNIQVTVLVLSYNPSWDKMKRTLNSVLMQTDINLEIIVTDDGSKDNMFDKIELLFEQNHFQNYLLLPSSVNEGICKNYLRGISTANGEYTKGISPGDYLYDERTLSEYYNYLKVNAIDVCFGNSIYYSDDKKGFKCYKVLTCPKIIKIYQDYQKYRNFNHKRKIRFCYLVANDMIMGASTMAKTNILISYITKIVGRIKYTEDTIFRMMVCDNIDIYYFDRKILWYEYGTGISTSENEQWGKLLDADLSETFKIMYQDLKVNDFFSFRYKWFLYFGAKKIFRYIIFPEVVLYELYKRIYPTYTEVISPTEFYEKIGKQ